MMRIWRRLVAFTLMSAVNGQVSRMDRAAHLRANPISLDQLWAKAKIVHFSAGRLAVSADTNQLRFLDAAEIAALVESEGFKSGERYF